MKYIMTFIIAMLPLIELRGAIPYAQLQGVPLPIAYIIAIVANMLPVPLIYFFARRVLVWGKDKAYIGKFFTYCVEKGEKAGRKLEAGAGRGGIFMALFLFVALPLPGTGAWTGTLAAACLDLDPRTGIGAVMLGVLGAGVIMSVVGSGLVAIFT